MKQEEFSQRIKENWSAGLRDLYRDEFEFVSGKVSVSPSGVAYVGAIGTWEVTIELPLSLQQGGNVWLQLNNSLGANWTFDVLQMHNPKGEGYVSLDSSQPEAVELNVRRPGLIVVSVQQTMDRGERIKIVLGDTSDGSAGARLKQYTQKVDFYVSLRKDESSSRILFEQAPSIQVLPLDKHFSRLIAPSTISSNDSFVAKLIYMDRFGNPADSDVETIDVSFKKMSSDQPERIYVYEGPLNTRSNPIIQTPSDEDLYWGEIHGHSCLSDGLESPRSYYEYARDIEMLDFCSVTDHDTWLDQRKWEKIRNANRLFCEEGSFVTLLGFEWSSAQWNDPQERRYGHKCVYYPSLDGDFYSHLSPECSTPEGLWQSIAPLGGISIAHHPAYADREDSVWGTDWDHHDDQSQPLVEIYSKHGLSEVFGNRWPLFTQNQDGFVQQALARGCKLGFTGGSDTHIGRPGSNMQECRRGIRYARAGITGVWASELTRQGIFDALKNRHCYATTGERIIVKFSLDGHTMGSVVSRQEIDDTNKVNLDIFVAGTDRLEKVELIKNNELVDVRFTMDDFIRFEHVDAINNANSFYYVRVTQVDGNMAWSSPIWVT